MNPQSDHFVLGMGRVCPCLESFTISITISSRKYIEHEAVRKTFRV